MTGADTLLAGTDGEGFFRTTDNGNSWTPVTSGLQGAIIETLARNETTFFLFTASDSGVYRSSDSGVSWTEVSTGLGEAESIVNDIALNNEGHLFAGTETGEMFRSTDNGDTWTAVNNGLGAYVVWTVAIEGSDRIYAGSIKWCFRFG